MNNIRIKTIEKKATKALKIIIIIFENIFKSNIIKLRENGKSGKNINGGNMKLNPKRSEIEIGRTVNSIIQRNGIKRKLKMSQIEFSIMKARDIESQELLKVTNHINIKILRRF